jgi:hypothetical protein
MRIFVYLALFCFPALGYADDRVATIGQVLPLETFEQYQPPAFPEQWKVRGDEDEARTIYQVVEEDGNRFLRARAYKQGVQIGLARVFQPKAFPLLRWRWRVEQLPPGADERSKKTNDSAAAVYVIFDSRIMPRAIKYVWSSTLPVGTRIDSPVYWRAKVVVLQSGPSSPGEWRQETVNFYQDYKELFGFEPGEVQGVAVLTDSDMTGSVAEADYDDFTLLTTEAISPENSTETSLLLTPALAGEQ